MSLEKAIEALSTLEEFFHNLDDGIAANNLGNAAYIVQQAQDYLACMKLASSAPDVRFERTALAFAKSEMMRIAALVVRECGARGWSFEEVLNDGVEYEQSVVADMLDGRRKADSHKGKHLIKDE